MTNASPARYFSSDYATARARFREAAGAAGATLSALALDGRGPDGAALATDIAWLGVPDAARLVLHSSGLHGVEAYAGAAIQLAALDSPQRPPPGCALVLVHVLNPWGMAWSRRTDEGNVDLNRNFLREDEARPGAAPTYAAIDPVINPASPPGFDFFFLAAAGLLLRHGLSALRQAVAEGQYSHPRGLFYGGAKLQPGPRRYLEWLERGCARARYVLALDVHTGLGRRGASTLILEPGVGVTPPGALGQALKSPLVDPARGEAAYVARGSMASRLPQALPAARLDFVLQEFGTGPVLRVFRALREENRWHHYGDGTLDHPAKRALVEALCPASPEWRRQVVEQGLALLHAACDWTFSRERQQ